MEILENFKNELKKIEESLKTEFSSLRVGRATPALVENILVDCYGSKIPIKQLASISAPEPRILIIEPWDRTVLPNLEKAILTSNLNLNPIVDKNLIRINIPPLTEERRNALIKIIGSKLEETKIKHRNSRDKIIKEINELFDAKKITEDEKFKIKEEIQKLVDLTNKNLENSLKLKEEEIKRG
ncbi:ribosome recycling factor [Candidatus Azambacteria bacterium RIFCSPHIGHO2_01_FULL_40_24]|uniref:Ribosome-recycling factor n=1 Tax=Candidatus Azambacteria bacterium RIFCSPHIGHO2_01_FULL_40_24 TaxID=1797301 RepID=A0A1F5B1V5_9BACT|nr:MAG: ribosome recycling factor [Candidatus Azambacteria bacterium RIFCSPHIGHO2_01_FULL_40_24]